MRSWTGAIGVLAIALALLAMPAGAVAKQSFDVQERSLRSTLSVKGSNGFRGIVSTEGHKQVRLTLTKGDLVMELQTSGRVSRHGIEARFGDLATVSVRFQGAPDAAKPKPRRRESRSNPTPGCSGRDPVVERGVFHGTIHFRGENDFARVDAKRAPGVVERRFRRVCKRSPLAGLEGLFEELFGGLRLTLFEAHARVDGATVVFEAAKFDFGPILGAGASPSYAFIGRSTERREGVRITRAASIEEAEGGFRAGSPGALPQHATVAPPKPFLGSAKHLKQAGAPASWVGPLAVRLPGAGLVPLTGAGFKSALCGRTLDELRDRDRCLPPRDAEPESNSLAALARAAFQGSGSQSQAFWDARLSWSR
jgi:hypothetical protein